MKQDPRASKYDDRSIQVVKLLLAASNGDMRALERAYMSGLDMNIGDYDKRTALHLACCEGHVTCIKFLIEVCNVDVNVKDRWGFTPYEEALTQNNTSVVNILRKYMKTSEILSSQIPETEEDSGHHSDSTDSNGTDADVSLDQLKISTPKPSEPKISKMITNSAVRKISM